MTESRDHCPGCNHKLHPQEMETLFRGKKLDCWYCSAPLEARAKGHLGILAQVGVGVLPFADTVVGDNPPEWLGFVLAGLVVAAIRALPPGFIHGAPWVRIVDTRSDFLAVEAEAD